MYSNTETAQRIRALGNRDGLKAAINGMTDDEIRVAMAQGEPLGIEVRRFAINDFIVTRRLARENAEMRNDNSASVRSVRRNIDELERSQYAFLNSANILRLRRNMRDLKAHSDKLRDIAGRIGEAVEMSAFIIGGLMPRDFALDLLNVGSAAVDLQYFSTYNPSIREIISGGFADESSRGKQNRNIEPMQYCLHRAGRKPYVAAKIEATPERFSEKAAELDAFCDEINSLALTIKANANGMDDCAGRPAAEIRSMLDAYVTLLERAFALWERVQPALMDCREFSIEQKAALLKVDPAKLADKDFPDGTTLLEMVTAQMEGDFMPDHEVGRFLWLGVGAHSSEPREHVEFYRGALAQEALTAEAHARGAVVFNAVGTLQ